MSIIKICGITNEADRDICVNRGCDLLGFNIYKGSRRYVDNSILGSLVTADVRSSAVLVGVNNTYDEWVEYVEKYLPAYIQFSGTENIRIVEDIKKKYPDLAVIKRVGLDMVCEYDSILETADYILMDYETAMYGGSGKSFSWDKLSDIDKSIRSRLFVAGGVNLYNIKELLEYDVFGVDVATGSEVSPGKKDPDKIKKLIETVKKYGR